MNCYGEKREKVLLKNSIDVLHVHDLYMSKSAAEAIKSSKIKIPLILDLHENLLA